VSGAVGAPGRLERSWAIWGIDLLLVSRYISRLG